MSVRALKVTDEIAALLERVECEGDTLSLEPLGQLDRPTYTALDKVLREAGGKWSRSLRAHLFVGLDTRDVVDRLLLTREVTSAKRALQQFDTPSDLAAELVAATNVQFGDEVLEPSAGVGNLVRAIRKAGGDVTAYEIDPSRARVLMDGAGLMGAKLVIEADFLGHHFEPTFDRVVMNPPFTRGQDIEHVMHALTALKPGGWLGAIVSSSAFTRQTKRHEQFKHAVTHHAYSVTDIEPGRFKQSGTMVPVSMLVVQKG